MQSFRDYLSEVQAVNEGVGATVKNWFHWLDDAFKSGYFTDFMNTSVEMNLSKYDREGVLDDLKDLDITTISDSDKAAKLIFDLIGKDMTKEKYVDSSLSSLRKVTKDGDILDILEKTLKSIYSKCGPKVVITDSYFANRSDRYRTKDSEVIIFKEVDWYPFDKTIPIFASLLMDNLTRNGYEIEEEQTTSNRRDKNTLFSDLNKSYDIIWIVKRKELAIEKK